MKDENKNLKSVQLIIDGKHIEWVVYDETKEKVELKVVNKNRNEAYHKRMSNLRGITAFIDNNEGSYIQLIYQYSDTIFKELRSVCSTESNANIHMVRFIQLATYSTFGGKLFDKQRNRIKRSSLKNIWLLNDNAQVKRTYDILIKCGYIYETEEGYLMINRDIVVKGKVDDFSKMKRKNPDITYTRLYAQNFQHLYEETYPPSRRHLSILLKILPYLNYKLNIFCSNPMEEDTNNIIPLDWVELAAICGIEKSKLKAFKKNLSELTIFGSPIIDTVLTNEKQLIYINPKIYYSGDDVEDVRYLYKIFKMCENE